MFPDGFKQVSKAEFDDWLWAHPRPVTAHRHYQGTRPAIGYYDHTGLVACDLEPSSPGTGHDFFVLTERPQP